MRTVFVVLLLLGSWLHGTAQKATELLPVKVKGKWGYINKQGQIVITPQFDAAGYFDLSLMAKVIKDGKVKLISYKGGKLQELETGRVVHYDDLNTLSEDVIAYKQDGKWGLTNWNGDALLPNEYDNFKIITITRFRKYILSVNGKYNGLLDLKGNVLVSATYTKVVLGNAAISVFKNNKWGLIDYDGKTLIDCKADNLTEKDNLLWSLSIGGNSYAYSIKQKTLIKMDDDFEFSQVPSYPDFLYITSPKGLGIMAAKGGILVKPEYDNIVFRNGYIHVYNGNKEGLYTFRGKKIIEPEFHQIESFKEHVALVRNNYSWGLINDKGVKIVPAIYKDITVAGSSAKCKRSDTEVDVYELSDAGEVTNFAEYNNVITVTSYYHERSIRSFSSTRTQVRNLSVGWYYNSSVGLWGYRDEKLNTLLKPQFLRVKDFPHLKLAVVEVQLEETSSFRIGELYLSCRSRYGIINTETLEFLYPPSFLFIDVDAIRYWDNKFNYTRALMTDGTFVTLHKSGIRSRNRYSYIGPIRDGICRYAIDGTIRRQGTHVNSKKGIKAFTVVELLNDLTSRFNYNSSMWWWRSTYNYSPFNIEGNTKQHDILEVKDGKWGYLGYAGLPFVQAKYSMAYNFYGKSAIAILNDKYGVLDASGTTKLPFQFQHIGYLEGSDSSLYEITDYSPNSGMIDSLGNVVINIEYRRLFEFSNGIVRYQNNKGRYGYAALNKGEIGDTILRSNTPFVGSLAAVRLKRYWGLMDKDGSIVIETKYTRMGEFSEGMAPVYHKGKYGYIDAEGKLVIDAQFKRAEPFKNGYAVVTKNSKRYGYIKPNGEWLVKPKYRKAENFNRFGYAVVKGRRGYGLIDKEGNRIIKPIYTGIDFGSQGDIVLRKGMVSFIYKPDSDQIIRLGKIRVQGFKNGYAVFTSKGKLGVIDNNGNIIREAVYSTCSNVSEGYYAARNGRQFYIMSIRGDTLYHDENTRYEGDIEGGLLMVYSSDSGYYYINTLGTNTFKRYFDEAHPFENGLARVKYDGKWGVINSSGLEVVKPKYSSIDAFENGYAKVSINYTKGVATNIGNIIFYPKYEQVSLISQGLFRVERGNEIGYLSADGEWIWAMQD